MKTSAKTSKKKPVKAVKKVAAKRPAKAKKAQKKVAVKKLSKLPALLDRTVAGKILNQRGTVTSAGEKKTVDSTTAWAQKRGLKQIVIWGPESVRDKIRTAATRAGVPMSTWILDAVSDKLGIAKSVKKTAAVVTKKSKSKLKKSPKTSGVSGTSDVFVDDGSKGINMPSSASSADEAEAAA